MTSHQAPRPTTHLHSSIDSSSDDDDNDPRVEIWLDLRDTAILPQAALEHMNVNQWVTDDDTTSSSMIDRILISGSDVARVVKQMTRDEENIPETLYVDNQDQTIRSVEDASHVLGGVVSLNDDEFTDPLPALDIMSNGGWVVIDSEEIADEDKRDQAVGGMVDFLAAGASSSASSSSLLLGVDKSDQGDKDKGDAAGNKGGIALSCTNKNDVLRAGSYSQSVASSGSLTTTDGGILIQSSADVTSSLRIAVAIPFDAMLWKAAAVVFQRGDDE